VLLLVFYVAVIAADLLLALILMTLSRMDRYYHSNLLAESKWGLCGTACLSHNSGKWQRRSQILDRQSPWFRLFTPGPTYHLFRLSLPLPPKFEEVEIFGGIPGNLHLFAQLVQQNLIYGNR